jgi:type VI secretion system protein ImpM
VSPRLLSIGAFGKIPSQGDFVRVNCVSPAVGALDRWLQESNESMHGAGVTLPSTPLSFLFRATGMREVLIGVAAGSEDSVHRRFPLVVFAAFDAAEVASLFSVLPTACARFFGAGAQLVSAAAQLTAAELAARVQSLPLPSAQEFAIADEMRSHTLGGARSSDLVARLFAAPPSGRQYYAFRTAVAACEPLRARDPDKPGLTLDCPVTCDVDRLMWLELVRRLLAWRDAPPSALWSDEPTPRLLISLGPTPTSLFTFHCRPDHGSTSLWPMSTERADAIETARQAMRPTHRASLDGGDLNLEALLTSLTS